MAYNLVSRHLQKLGRYSKEFIKITFTDTASTAVPVDTRLSVPLYGVIHTMFDQANTPVTATIIIAANQVTVSNRVGATLNGHTITLELTGY